MIDLQHSPDGKIRLVASRVMAFTDFADIAHRIASTPFAARQIGFIAARTADKDERVETRWNGHETINTARPGDRIVTSLDAGGLPLVDREGNHNTYVITAARFVMLYELADPITPLGKTYRARANVTALAFPGGLDIVAPWGERQRADNGYLILNGEEVYGNNAETFEANYVRLE